MSNAKLLQSQLCISNNTRTWFAAKVSDYTCLSVGSHRGCGPILGSAGRALARNLVQDPPPRRFHNGQTWCMEDPVLFSFPRQDVTMPRPIDPRRANALISRLMREISVEPLSPPPSDPGAPALERDVSALAPPVPLPDLDMMGSDCPLFPSLPAGDVASSGILPRPRSNRADLLGALQPGLSNLLSPRREGRSVRGKGGMTLSRGTKGLEQSGGAQLPLASTPQGLFPPPGTFPVAPPSPDVRGMEGSQASEGVTQ